MEIDLRNWHDAESSTMHFVEFHSRPAELEVFYAKEEW